MMPYTIGPILTAPGSLDTFYATLAADVRAAADAEDYAAWSAAESDRRIAERATGSLVYRGYSSTIAYVAPGRACRMVR